MLLFPSLIVKVDALAIRNVNHASPVAAPLHLVLLLGEALALCHNQILVRPLRVVDGDVGVGGEAGVDLDVLGDAREGLVLGFAAALLDGVRGQGRVGGVGRGLVEGDGGGGGVLGFVLCFGGVLLVVRVGVGRGGVRVGRAVGFGEGDLGGDFSLGVAVGIRVGVGV